MVFTALCQAELLVSGVNRCFCDRNEPNSSVSELKPAANVGCTTAAVLLMSLCRRRALV